MGILFKAMRFPGATVMLGIASVGMIVVAIIMKIITVENWWRREVFKRYIPLASILLFFIFVSFLPIDTQNALFKYTTR